MGLLDDFFPKPRNIASEILGREVKPGGVGERLPASSNLGADVLRASSQAQDAFLDTEPTIANAELARNRRDQIVHVDNAIAITGPVTAQPQKKTFIETTIPLAANAFYRGQWHDSDLDGSVYAIITALSDQSATAGTFQVLLSDDITKNGFTFNSTVGALSPAAGQKMQYPCYLRARYWMIVYQNGPTPQGSFEITVTTFSNWMGTFNTGQSAAGQEGFLVVAPANNAGAGTFDNDPLSGETLVVNSGSTGGLLINHRMYGGKFSASADAIRQGWSGARTPTVFRQVSTAATGSTALWTPATGNKFRVLRFRVSVTALAKAAVAADLVIDLFDAAVSMKVASVCTIPVAAAGNGVILDTGWIDLGAFGILSAAINQALNVNLSFALTGGLVNVQVAGTEE